MSASKEEVENIFSDAPFIFEMDAIDDENNPL